MVKQRVYTVSHVNGHLVLNYDDLGVKQAVVHELPARATAAAQQQDFYEFLLLGPATACPDFTNFLSFISINQNSIFSISSSGSGMGRAVAGPRIESSLILCSLTTSQPFHSNGFLFLMNKFLHRN